MLSEKSIIELRTAIEQMVRKYRTAGNTEHVKLDIDPDLLHKILFAEVEDTIDKHLEIAISYGCLRTLDLTGIVWDNVKVVGIDFSTTKGVCINPQKVYHKDLTRTVLKNVEINGDFHDAKIRYTDFSGAKGKLKIDLQKIGGKTVEGAKLEGVEIVGDYDDVCIRETNFKNAIGNKSINPLKIRDGDFENTVLDGVVIVGCSTLKKEKIRGANFTGSTGAVLYVEREEELEKLKEQGTILTDVHVIIEYNQVMEKIEKAFAKQKTKKNG